MNILITKKLPASLLTLVDSWKWTYDVVPALDITPADVFNIPATTDAWIISSRNSLHAIEKFKDAAPKAVFVIGQWLSNKLHEIIHADQIFVFQEMTSLTAAVVERKFSSIVYFCGDNHRDDLARGLNGSATVIEEVITHYSRQTFPRLTKTYDSAMAFSPRSIESLLEYNKFPASMHFMCIGPTTEKHLHTLNYKNTFCASSPDSLVLLTEFHDSTSPLQKQN